MTVIDLTNESEDEVGVEIEVEGEELSYFCSWCYATLQENILLSGCSCVICPTCCNNYREYNGTVEVYCSKQNHSRHGGQQVRKIYELACAICQEDSLHKPLQAISCGLLGSKVTYFTTNVFNPLGQNSQRCVLTDVVKEKVALWLLPVGWRIMKAV
ncbi:uncharacterized protein ColSpa_12783 [Colletotrichum spaethianum]|uniref:Uncharacterized protein n=1 Tax=Colletotrichum spaethianum TaxID=700344 RepID=A0AA37PI55_9PEZI|nr:uncharacterized protein ColSpa_12783 [Colletotrichum spaethianum]GKT52602.1 hypothetical protein ColSpa_12783 [Colletotrichum spaethianum]